MKHQDIPNMNTSTKFTINRIFLSIIFSFLFLNAYAEKKIDIFTIPLGSLQVGMPASEFKIRIENTGENLSGNCSIILEQPLGVRVDPTKGLQAKLFVKGISQTIDNVSYNQATKTFILNNLTLLTGDSITLIYYAIASYEAIPLPLETRSYIDNVTFNLGVDYSVSSNGTNSSYNVLYPKILLTPQITSVEPDWNTTVTDSIIISNEGDGSIDGFNIISLIDGTQSDLIFDMATIMLASDTTKKYIFKNDEPNKYIVTPDILGVLNSTNLFLPSTKFLLKIKYKVAKAISRKIQFTNSILWNAKDINGQDKFIESNVKIFEITSHENPNALLEINSKIIKLPTPCDQNGIMSITVKNNSLDKTPINTLLDLNFQIACSNNTTQDSLKIGDLSLSKKIVQGEWTTWSMPETVSEGLDLMGLKKIACFDGQSTIYNDLEPGGSVVFTLYFTYEQKFDLFSYIMPYVTVFNTKDSTITNSNYYYDSDHLLTLVTNGLPSEIFVGSNYQLSIDLNAPNANASHDLIDCPERKFLLKGRIPIGFKQPTITCSTPDVPVNYTITGDVSTGWDISIITPELGLESLLNKTILLNVEPITCEAVGENKTIWFIPYFICHSCQNPEDYFGFSYQGVNLTVFPNEYCSSTGNGGWETLLPKVSIERISMGYYIEGKRASDIWKKEELTSENKIIWGSPEYRTLVAENKINPKLFFPSDSAISILDATISASMLEQMPDTLVATFSSYSLSFTSKNLFIPSYAVFHMAGTDYKIENVTVKKYIGYPECYIYEVKIPRVLLQNEEFVAGEISTKLYSQVQSSSYLWINDGATSGLIKYKGNYKAILPNNQVIKSFELSDLTGFSIKMPYNISVGVFPANDYNSLVKTNFIRFLYDSRSTVYSDLKSEYRETNVLVDSIELTIPGGADLLNFRLQIQNSVFPINNPILRQVDNKSKWIIPIDYLINQNTYLFYDYKPKCNPSSYYAPVLVKWHYKYVLSDDPYNSDYTFSGNATYYSIYVNISQNTNQIALNQENNIVEWPISLRASESSFLNWLILKPIGINETGLDIVNVMNDDTKEIYLPTKIGNTTYIKTGFVKNNEEKKYIVKARFANCLDYLTRDTISVETGWTSDNNYGISDICKFANQPFILEFENKPSSVKVTDSKNVNNRYGLCEFIPVDVKIKNNNISDIKKVGFWFTYKNNALQLIGDTISYAYGPHRGILHTISDSLLIPNNSNISTALEIQNGLTNGILHSMDSIQLHFNMVLNCVENEIIDLSNVRRLEYTAGSYSVSCGTNLFPEKLLYNIHFKGFEAVDAIKVNVSSDKMTAQSTTTKVNVSLENISDQIVDSVYVEAKIPQGFTYQSSNLSEPIIQGSILLWKVAVESTLNLSFTLIDQTNCSDKTLEIPIRTYLLRELHGCSSSCLFQYTLDNDTLKFNLNDKCIPACSVSLGPDVTICKNEPYILSVQSTDCTDATNCGTTVTSPFVCMGSPITGNENLTVYKDETVFVSNYRGEITLKGGTLVICGNNNPIPTIVLDPTCSNTTATVVINGVASFNTITLNGGKIKFINYGTGSFNQALSGVIIENYGLMSFNAAFNNTLSFYNSAYAYAHLGINNTGIFKNDGTIIVNGLLLNTSSTSLINNCFIKTNTLENDNQITNAGNIIVKTASLFMPESHYTAQALSLFETNTLDLNGAMSVEGTACSTLKINESAIVGASASSVGNLNICGITTTNLPEFNSSVSFNCTCATKPVNDVQYLWTPSEGLNNPAIANPTILNPSLGISTIYKVTVTGNGKVGSDEIQVNVEDCQ